MGISIAVCSGKGGTGKTTISANLGVSLSQFGKDVIIINPDVEMGDMGLIFGLEGVYKTLYDVLAGEVDVSEAIYDGPGGVKVVPIGISLNSMKKADPDKLEDVINILKEVEILIIDAPAGLGRGVMAVISSAQEILLVVNPEISSMSDALKTKIVANKLGAHVLGIVLNRATFDSMDMIVREIEYILETPILAVVPEDPEVKHSSAFGVPVVIKNPNAPAAVAIKKLAADLIGEEHITPDEKKPFFVNRLISGLFGN